MYLLQESRRRAGECCKSQFIGAMNHEEEAMVTGETQIWVWIKPLSFRIEIRDDAFTGAVS